MLTLTASVRRAALGAATAVFSLALVTGCGAEKIAEKATEKALEGAAQGSADIDLDEDGGMKIETDEGSLSVGQGLPEDFPSDDVPLPEGEVLSGMSMSGEGWSVSLAVDGAADDVVSQVSSMLDSAGYKTEATTQTGGMTILTTTNDTYAVTAAVIDDSGATNVSYTVVFQQE